MADPQPPQPPVPPSPDERGAYNPPPAHPERPPTTVGYAAPPPRQSAWPTVLGIISIIWGSLGALGGCWSVVAMFFWEPYTEFLSSATPGGNPGVEAMKEMEMDHPAMIAGTVLGFVLAILLIVAGAYLLKRRQRGATWCRIYAICYIPVIVLTSLLNARMQMGMFENQPQMPAEFVNAMGVFSIVCGVLIGSVWPVFLLIWLSRSKIKAEVAGWQP